MRFLVVFGTRPEAIKLAPVVQELRRLRSGEVRVCVTGQHKQMLDQVLSCFDIRPDYSLAVMRHGQDLTDVTAACLTGLRPVLREWRPDWLLVQGDTSTTFSAALAAFYEKVPVAHVEAGLRTGDLRAPWPEELNRRLTSVMAALHFAPTERARRNLLSESIDPRIIYLTGNTVIDALLHVVRRIESDETLRGGLAEQFSWLDPARRLILVTGHRRESFGPPLEQICLGLRQIGLRKDVQVVYPVHLNPNVREPVKRLLGGLERVHLMEPLDYLQFVYLMTRSEMIITDSGGIQEEAPTLGKPVLVMRDTTERPEAIEAGTARLVGTDAGKIDAETARLLDDRVAYEAMARAANPYGNGQAARRIGAVLCGREVAAAF